MQPLSLSAALCVREPQPAVDTLFRNSIQPVFDRDHLYAIFDNSAVSRSGEITGDSGDSPPAEICVFASAVCAIVVAYLGNLSFLLLVLSIAVSFS